MLTRPKHNMYGNMYDTWALAGKLTWYLTGKITLLRVFTAGRYS
jgi:hypothetical protein